ncbi:GEVED domain-containing protein [Psychroserpens mesophilus]|uniref:GEVED domain-containing protein n=1 Tax=Psychroserpens mesophilus TaxID=325473 RepID=UPI00058AD3A3|nr:GEVED domain-containing protein [Psychroserpens mesophilus]
MIKKLLLDTFYKKVKYAGLCLLFLICFAIDFQGHSQTTHLNPATNGGFELGTTFAANGWTATTGGATQNQWVCNTGATTGFTGIRAAYVTNARNANPPPHTYANNNGRVTHIYRDITVPAGESNITLNFDWICDGETTYDRMRIWLVPTTWTPTYGTEIGAAGTAPTGRIQVGGNYSEQYTWQNSTETLPTAYAGTTFRLVFEWRNDASLGGNPPIAIDNISLISDTNTSYCTPNPTSVDNLGITNVSFGAVNNTTGAEAGNYGDYSAMIGTGTEGSALPINITYQTGYTYDTTIWVDWNDDFDFADAGEVAYTGTSLGANPTTLAASITIPVGASTSGLGTGLHRMRIGGMDFGPMTDPCYTGSFACFEDYTISVTVPGPCVTPLAQPTGLTFGAVTNSTIDGSFTASAPASSNYLVLMNTTGTAPTAPTNGTTYAIGNTALGATVVDNDTNLNFSATGLTANTTYYFFIYAFNDVGCTGGPLYNTVSPLTGNETTDTYCSPSSSDTNYYIDDFITTGAITNINHTGTGFSTNGYGNFTTLSVEQFASSNIDFTINFVGGTFETNIWVDWNNDGDFVDGGEKVYDSPGYSDPTVGSFTVAAVAGGSYRMRVRSDWLNSDPSSCGFDDDSETHDYTLIVTPLNCNSNPENLTAFATTTTTATVSWTDPTTPPGNGYEYIISTDNTTSTPAGDITGTTTGTSINLTGLVANTMYYVFVRSVCNAVDNGIWFTISFNTGCVDLDYTPNVCEMVIAEVGIDPFAITPYNSNPDYTIGCNANTIELATNAQMNETTSYDVIKIPYETIRSSGATIDNSSITNDDYWADDPTAIGFPFCFYDNEYDYTLAGANSMITFDINAPGAPYFMTGTNTPGTSCDYDFSDDLPSTANSLFEQTIYGVYHDIDPRGLPANAITTRTQGTPGCRLFVASWRDIPMYSDASRLYSGLIVLYETTNIIEVYIEEKRIENGDVNPWNGGNAIVGIQGDITPLLPNNQYSVAPCRNGLDTNWETTNEAWRFVPSGNSRLTGVEWYNGTDTSGTPDATTNTYTVSAAGTYTAISTYTTCSGSTVTLTDEIVITHNGKVWDGSTSSDWMEPTNWSDNLVPTAADCVIIPATANDPIIYDDANGDGLYMVIENGATLTLTSDTNSNGFASSLTIQDYIDIQGSGELFVQDDASLIQVYDSTTVPTPSAANSGNITLDRNTNIRLTDYVYWSSPVQGFDVSTVYGGFTPSNYIYQWTPTVPTGTNAPGTLPTGGMPICYGNWDPYSSGNMALGKGYIVRAPTNHTAGASIATAVFNGVPNNGVITQQILSGNNSFGNSNYTYNPYGVDDLTVTPFDDNWNLLGNPYPSALDAQTFLTHPSNSIIEGAVHIWTHGTQIGNNGDSFYEDYSLTYDVADYTTYNFSGTNTYDDETFAGKIASGQGFFVLALNDNESGSVTFNNSMRDRSHSNTAFYRNSNEDSDSNAIERHRIWLNLIDQNGSTSSILVGYIEGATQEKDRLYDAYAREVNSLSMYSKIGNQRMIIQGRALPFDPNDQVPLGTVIPQPGQYTIAINNVDGLFLDENQNIYLEDLNTGIIHDLRAAPYTFTETEAIDYDTRFILRYTNEALSMSELELSALSIIVPKGDYIKINSDRSPIDSVIVYDLLGRILYEKNAIRKSEFVLNNHNLSAGTYIVKATLTSGVSKAQKIVLKN